MKKFYVQDSTIDKFVYFETVAEVVKYLEQVVQRAYGLNRQQYTQNLMDLGYGPDDRDGVTFTRAVADQFNIGVVTPDGKQFKTDIHTATCFERDEYDSSAHQRFEDRGKF